ncbi:MAG: hypothetical protein IKP66_10340 [Lachnospiraceae bacterium]|nr:hypothetical protein [Lachnospiraceae bacterium]
MKRLVAVVLIVSMIFTTGGFATLADSVSDVIETSESGKISQAELSHKYYDDLVGASDDEPSSNEYTEEPEVDETTASSDEEQDFDGEETTTAEETTTVEETTTYESEETTSTSEDSTVIAPNSSIEESTTEESFVGAKLSEPAAATDSEISVATEENTNIENQTETENNISTNSNIVANEDENISTPNELFGEKENIATLSNAEELSLDIASLSEITSQIDNNLYGFTEEYWLGTFEQGDETGVQKEPVKWLVTRVVGNDVLLTTEKIIHHYQWHPNAANWGDSDMRKILNGDNLVLGDFPHKLFTQDQLDDVILTKTINAYFSQTEDKIFLLSWVEAQDRLYSDISPCRRAVATDFAKNYTFRAGEYLQVDAEGYSPWWLRSPKWESPYADAPTSQTRYVGADGEVKNGNDSSNPNVSGIGIRPSIYVDYSKLMGSNNEISFNLKGMDWKSGSTLWGQYSRYQVGQLLPTTANIDLPTDAELLYWGVNGSTTNTITQIPLGQQGRLNLSAIYKFKIQWDLEDGNTGVYGSWDTTAGGEGPDSYIDVEGISALPTNVNAPAGKFFDHWEIEGVAVNNIPVESSGNKTIKAVYGTLPNYVWYGTYPQNDITGGEVEPIKWRVLSQDGNEALLVSEDIIDHKYFNSDGGNIIWRDAGIRQWLDNTFKGNAFTSNQINNVIINKSLSTNEISGSVTTTDKVFLLSNDESSSLGSNSAKKAKGTEYAKNVILDGHSLSIYDGYSSWWLRSQSSPDNENTADTIDPSLGNLNYTDANSYGIGIRPAIYVNLKNNNFRTSQNNLYWSLGEGASFKNTSTLWNQYTTYQPGQKLPVEENLNIPAGNEFLGFRNINNQTIIKEIPMDLVGNVTLKLQYKRNINWILADGDTGNEGTWNGEVAPAYYDTEFGIPNLPTNITAPTDRVFDHWEIGGIKVTSIPAGDTGDKEIRAVYRGVQYNITWNLNDGTTGNIGEWMDNAGPSTYGYGDGVNPLPTNVKAPEGKSFDHWEIEGVPVTSIGTNEIGEKEIQAVYNNYPKTDFWFGTYPQSDGSGMQKEPIKWKVLNINDNEAFLVSDKILDYYRYYDSASYSVEWEDSDARVWLNNELLNNILSTSQIDDVVNKKIYISEQTATTDRLFLLSVDEANKYFANDNSRIATDSNYAYSKNTGNADFDQTLYRGEWWLRTGVPLLGQWLVCMVRSDGRLIRGFNSNPHQISPEQFLGLRPAIYINFSNNSVFRRNNNSITFDFSNGGNFKAESALWGEMTTYQGGQKLPTVDNLEVPEWKEFIGWGVNGNDNIIYTDEIPVETTGDLVLKALYRNAHFDLTFDMGEGHLISTPSEYEYSVGMQLPVAADIVSPTGRAFSHWEIDGVAVRDITPTDYGDKVLKAIFTNVLYGITFDMGEGHLVSTPSNYEYSVGLTLPASSEVVAPRGRSFDHWEIDGNTVTSITTTDYEDKVVVAKYTNNRYTITWDYTFLGREWSFVSGVNPPVEYEYGTGTALPGDSDVDEPRYILDEWFIYNSETDELTWGNSIDANYVGNVTLSAGFRPDTFNITYKNEDNTDVIWSGTAGPSQYTYHTGIPLLPTNVVAPANKEFDHWEIDGKEVSEIGYEEYGDKTIVAKYRNKQYNITWRLTEHNEFFDYDFVGDWNGTPGEDTYTYGTSYQLPTNITPPPGMLFDMWEFADNPGYAVTTISETDYGDKIIQAIYRSEEYNVTWNLNGAVLSVNADSSPFHPNVYMYGDVLFGPFQILDITDPDTFDSIPAGKTVSHWTINGVPATEIPQGTMGDLVITLVFTDIPTHNITWDYGSGENQWSFNGYIPPATYSEGTAVVFPDKSFVVAPNGKEIDYFTLNGNQATEIPATSTTDVTVGAVLKNKTYRIRYILGNGSWDGAAGAENYTHGTPYTLPTNVNGTTGQVFDHWEIGGVATASILASDYGHKEFTAVYDNKTYNINWVLKGATIDSTLTPDTYKYGTAVALPASTDITPATGLTFDHWEINGIVSTEIQAGTVGDVTVTLIYASDEIVWQLVGGQFRNYTAPSRYERGIGLTLPTPDQILAPNGYTFNYWLVNGTQNTVIPSDLTGAVIVKAVYSAIPTPAPEPYNPGGGGGSSGGGGGGGGGTITNNAAPLVTKINQIKTIKLAADISQITWVYEPITNKFKMNINVVGQTIPATDGFYLVSTIDERKVNGVTTYVPGTSTYCFDKEGNMVTGWVNTVDNKWYYLENVKTAREGMMVFGWYQVQSKWYYFLSDGTLLTNATTPDGFIVGTDGAWVQ